MKFLCVECDEAMKLINSTDSRDGTLNVIFQCPQCSREIAMLTNSMETQMVRAMDVKIGGKDKQAEPMEKLRSALISKKEDINISEEPISQVAENNDPGTSESKCPFPGMVEQMESQKSAKEDTVLWTEGAKERMQRIPDFVRLMVSKSIEQHAKEKGYTEINESVLDEVKGDFGM